MSTDREVTRIVRSWLEEGATVLPERVLDAVLAQVPATRQRRAWWPARRLPLLNTPMRIALAAVAVIVVAAIGVTLAPKTASVGGPPATPAPTPTATPIPLPLYPQTLTVPATAPYLAGAPFPIPISITVPAGWDGNVGGPYAAYLEKEPSPGTNDGAQVAFTLRQGLFADPCHGAAFLKPQPGPTVDDLASALVRLPAFVATTPTDVIVDGYHGRELTLAAPASFDGCTLTSIGYGLWQLPLGAVFSFLHGDRMTIRILDVGGHRLVVSSTTHPATSAQDRAEMQSILDSIHIQKPQ